MLEGQGSVWVSKFLVSSNSLEKMFAAFFAASVKLSAQSAIHFHIAHMHKYLPSVAKLLTPFSKRYFNQNPQALTSIHCMENFLHHYFTSKKTYFLSVFVVNSVVFALTYFFFEWGNLEAGNLF